MAENATATKKSTTTPKRGERGTGTSVAADLADYPELLAKIRKAADEDDRPPSVWLRRKLVALDAAAILF